PSIDLLRDAGADRLGPRKRLDLDNTCIQPVNSGPGCERLWHALSEQPLEFAADRLRDFVTLAAGKPSQYQLLDMQLDVCRTHAHPLTSASLGVLSSFEYSV